MPVYNSVLIDSFNKVIENILKIKGKFLIFSFLTSSHLYVSVVRSVRQSVGPSLGVETLGHVPEHDVAIIITSHQSLRVEIKTTDIVFNAEKPQTGAILQFVSYFQWQAIIILT